MYRVSAKVLVAVAVLLAGCNSPDVTKSFPERCRMQASVVVPEVNAIRGGPELQFYAFATLKKRFAFELIDQPSDKEHMRMAMWQIAAQVFDKPGSEEAIINKVCGP